MFREKLKISEPAKIIIDDSDSYINFQHPLDFVNNNKLENIAVEAKNKKRKINKYDAPNDKASTIELVEIKSKKRKVKKSEVIWVIIFLRHIYQNCHLLFCKE